MHRRIERNRPHTRLERLQRGLAAALELVQRGSNAVAQAVRTERLVRATGRTEIAAQVGALVGAFAFFNAPVAAQPVQQLEDANNGEEQENQENSGARLLSALCGLRVGAALFLLLLCSCCNDSSVCCLCADAGCSRSSDGDAHPGGQRPAPLGRNHRGAHQ
eukprot:SAG11_NODE_537_length_8672_cov_3.282632_1_plen_162_part_00